MLFLSAFQFDQFDIFHLRVQNKQVIFDYSTTAIAGTAVFISVNPQMPKQQLIFAKQFTISDNPHVILSCADQVIKADCDSIMSSLNKNLKANVTFELPMSSVTIRDLTISVDTNSDKSNLGLTIGLSVGGAVLIVLIIVAVFVVKKQRGKRAVLN
ncbi:Hypothetical_protein [Hexamita inflata]|uniref:Hypothetical_protein n=1 Tax=Hexamita inflata TaxID=28002 RepID=A0AA86QH75_9EUKA|nr:Hypothetical protein HINF_LOCUS46926 [Hexamita inflata]